jgi:hypothetical protein
MSYDDHDYPWHDADGKPRSPSIKEYNKEADGLISGHWPYAGDKVAARQALDYMRVFPGVHPPNISVTARKIAEYFCREIEPDEVVIKLPKDTHSYEKNQREMDKVVDERIAPPAGKFSKMVKICQDAGLQINRTASLASRNAVFQPITGLRKRLAKSKNDIVVQVRIKKTQGWGVSYSVDTIASGDTTVHFQTVAKLRDYLKVMIGTREKKYRPVHLVHQREWMARYETEDAVTPTMLFLIDEESGPEYALALFSKGVADEISKFLCPDQIMPRPIKKRLAAMEKYLSVLNKKNGRAKSWFQPGYTYASDYYERYGTKLDQDCLFFVVSGLLCLMDAGGYYYPVRVRRVEIEDYGYDGLVVTVFRAPANMTLWSEYNFAKGISQVMLTKADEWDMLPDEAEAADEAADEADAVAAVAAAAAVEEQKTALAKKLAKYLHKKTLEHYAANGC